MQILECLFARFCGVFAPGGLAVAGRLGGLLESLLEVQVYSAVVEFF